MGIFSFNYIKNIYIIFMYMCNFCASFGSFKIELVMENKRKKVVISDKLDMIRKVEAHLLIFVIFI